MLKLDTYDLKKTSVKAVKYTVLVAVAVYASSQDGGETLRQLQLVPVIVALYDFVKHGTVFEDVTKAQFQKFVNALLQR